MTQLSLDLGNICVDTNATTFLSCAGFTLLDPIVSVLCIMFIIRWCYLLYVVYTSASLLNSHLFADIEML